MRKILLLFLCVLFYGGAQAADVSLLLQNFGGFKAGDSLRVTDYLGNPSSYSSSVLEKDPKNSFNLAVHVKTSGEELFVEIPLPDGMTSKTATEGRDRISFRFYRSAADGASRSCKFFVYFGTTKVYSDASSVSQGTAGEWQTRTYSITKATNTKTVMRLGMSASRGDYYIDDIKVIGIDYMYDYTDPTQTARFYADQVGKHLGVAVNPGLGNDRMGQTVYRNFNMVVCENAMKFDATEPSRNSFSYSGGDIVVAFAQSHKMFVRGHALCWHSQVPSWVSSNGASATTDNGWTKQQLLDILKNHIFNVAGHYRGKVIQWDVVNECLDDNQPDMNSYKLRSGSVWNYVIGEEFIDSAFVWAHQADPDAELYLNDYNVGPWQGNPSWEVGKTHALYNLAKRLKDDGIPIDGVGLQSHTSVGNVSLPDIKRTFDEFQNIGLKCIITELDMNQDGASETAQADKYAGMVNIINTHDNAPSIVVWGTDDAHSWIEDSETKKPLLFNPDFSAKKAYLSVVQTFKDYSILMENKPIYMESDEDDSDIVTVYNLMGQKLNCSTRGDVQNLPLGLYIVNGKKVLIR